jgi:hypothetical protein
LSISGGVYTPLLIITNGAPVQAFGFCFGQEQVTLKPMIESINEQLDDDVFANGCVLTADTGYCSEENLEYLNAENIDAVVPDN